MTSRQVVYMVLDEIKSISDDSTFNEDHVYFLLGKYRAFLLQKEYERKKDELSEADYQEICLDVEMENTADPCNTGSYLKSIQKIPKIMEVSNTRIYPFNFSQDNIVYVPRNRFKYVSNNKYTQNFIYASLGPDNYLYLKSSNPQYAYLEKVRMSAIFEDYEEAAKLSCEGDNGDEEVCDVLDKEFKIDEYLVPTLIELVVKELLGASYRPADSQNNANDDLSDLVTFIRRNTKSQLQKQIEE